MQFQVPQFIDIAPKIVGPLTLKQFFYLAGAAIPSIILFFVLEFWLWIIITAIFTALALALAFGQFNGQPLVKVLISALGFFWKPRYYLWRRVEEPAKLPKMPKGFSSENSSIKDLILKMTTSTRPIEQRERPSRAFRALPPNSFEEFRKITGDRQVARRVDYR